MFVRKCLWGYGWPLANRWRLDAGDQGTFLTFQVMWRSSCQSLGFRAVRMHGGRLRACRHRLSVIR